MARNNWSADRPTGRNNSPPTPSPRTAPLPHTAPARAPGCPVRNLSSPIPSYRRPSMSYIVDQTSTPVNTSGILVFMTRSATLPPDVACCAPLVRQPLTADEATDLAQRLKAIAD